MMNEESKIYRNSEERSFRRFGAVPYTWLRLWTFDNSDRRSRKIETGGWSGSAGWLDSEDIF